MARDCCGTKNSAGRLNENSDYNDIEKENELNVDLSRHGRYPVCLIRSVLALIDPACWISVPCFEIL